MRTDHLRPSLVSQSVPTTLTGSSSKSRGGNPNRQQRRLGKQEISHMVTDATLSISVVAHGLQPKQGSASSDSSFYAKEVSLFQRTQPLESKRLVPGTGGGGGDWCIQDLLHLGRIKVAMSGEKEGKIENVAVVAAILGRLQDDDGHDGEDPTKVPTVGDDDDDDDDIEEDKSEDNNDDQCKCQVVVLIASRQDLRIQKRIRFLSLPNFSPLSAVHPSTYLNKIVVGGFDTRENTASMVLLNIRSGKIVHNFECLKKTSKDNNNMYSKITALAQSPAVDTIAVGTNLGMVHLVNLRHDKKLFSLEHKTKKGNQSTTITSISFRTDSSALQYGTAPMAVGRQDGTITIWDLTPPEDPNMGRSILCEMPHVHPPGGIAKLQFMPQEPLLLSTGTQSNAIIMHIFDNPDYSGRILRQRKGHTAPPRCIQYIHPGAGAGGGILANASDGTDASVCQILSAGGQDRTLRVFSTARTVSDKEYGQGRGLVKKAKQLGLDSTTELLLPPVIAMATSETRSRDWGDLVTIHESHAFAYVWSTRKGAQSGPVLRQDKWSVSAMKVPPPTLAHATCVAISACGNFALVGSRGGRIYKYNIQSGIPRGSFPKHDQQSEEEVANKKKRSFVPGDIGRAIKALEKSKKFTQRGANLDKMELDAEQAKKQEQQLQMKLSEASHVGFAVSGLAVDAINKTVVSVGADGKLILWNLVSHLPHKKSPYKLSSPATKLHLVRDSGLAAIALNDFSVLVFDTATQSIVRRFGVEGSPTAHRAPISDMSFSPDGRNLYTASMDSTLRVWDVPTDSCVDWLGFQTPPISIAVSPTGEFISTVHTGVLGLCVWSDRSFYETVYTAGEPPEEPAQMDDPTPLSDHWDGTPLVIGGGIGQFQQPLRTSQEASATNGSEGPPIPKEQGLVTLSGLAPSHWKNLFNLELVKERNKPKEAPNKPPSAPFFLQWRSGEAIAGSAEEKGEEHSKPDEWSQAWSDDDNDDDWENEGGDEEDENLDSQLSQGKEKRKTTASEGDAIVKKKRKIVRHARSHLASLLLRCRETVDDRITEKRYSDVTEYVATLGPSAIDVALSTLCHGQHDLEEGIVLLRLAAAWLLEEMRSRERYEAVNAYLHRFLHLHASVIAGIDEDKKPETLSDEAKEEGSDVHREQRLQLTAIISQLRETQRDASSALRNKMQRATCMLRHFSRMV